LTAIASDHALHTELGEALTDQRMRPLSGIPSAPSRLAQPVTKLDLAGRGVLNRPEMEPSQEVPGGLLDDRPETVALIPPVIAKECGQIFIFDLLAGRGCPPGTKRMTSGSASRLTRLSASATLNRRSTNRCVSRKTCIARPFQYCHATRIRSRRGQGRVSSARCGTLAMLT
jgi:hypothetical protein